MLAPLKKTLEAKGAELRDCRIVQGGSGCLTGIREMLAPLKKSLEGVSRRPDVQNFEIVE